MQKISPFLWFNDDAEEAVNHYISIFNNSRIVSTMPGPDGKVMGITFELEGQKFMALNGGPMFRFSPAISLYVDCADQSEVDHYWGRLTAGGEEEMCGWLRDKYGVSWQIIPRRLIELLGDPNPERSGAAVQAMLKMKKIEVADLEQAATV